MPDIRSYADADAFMHTRGKPVPRKKFANNTYLERIGDTTIALRLHNTHVVTWSEDGLVQLNTGGWLTVTTKDRINSVLPGTWRLSSVKGTWFLASEYGRGASYRYRDGLQMRSGFQGWDVVVATTVPESDAEREDRHNTAMRKQIGKFVATIDASKIKIANAQYAGDCILCRIGDTIPGPTEDRPIYVSIGDQMGDTQHLVEHMLEGYLTSAIMLSALSEAGYLAHNMHGVDTIRRTVRAYLSRRLFIGATAPAHGRRPLPVAG